MGLSDRLSPSTAHHIPDEMFGRAHETISSIAPESTPHMIQTHHADTMTKSAISSQEGDSDRDMEKGYEPVESVHFTIDDPENPHNWSRAYRWYITMIASLLVVCIAYGSSIVTGGLDLIEEKYNVSSVVAILTCSIMVCGFAVGPLLWSPLSEIIGRQPVYIISLGLYVIFNIPCALAPNIGGLLVCRFLCGVFSSSGLALAGGTIADVWDIEERGMAIAYFAAAPYCGPVLGPIVCGWINVGTRRLDLFFWVNMAFAGVVLILVGMIPETYAPVILKRRASKLRKEAGADRIAAEPDTPRVTFREIARTSLIRPITMIMTDIVFDLMCMYIVLIYAMLYAFFCAYPVIFGKLYNPEDRLIAALIGAPFIPIALFILGATSFQHIIWVGPASSGIAFGFGMVLCYYAVNNYIIDSYHQYAASALAAKVFLRSGGGAAFPLFITQMYNRLGLQWASWLLAFIGLAMVLIPYGFYIFGGRLRARLTKS